MNWIQDIKDGYNLSTIDGTESAITELRGAKEHIADQIKRLQKEQSEVSMAIIQLNQSMGRSDAA